MVTNVQDWNEKHFYPASTAVQQRDEKLAQVYEMVEKVGFLISWHQRVVVVQEHCQVSGNVKWRHSRARSVSASCFNNLDDEW